MSADRHDGVWWGVLAFQHSVLQDFYERMPDIKDQQLPELLSVVRDSRDLLSKIEKRLEVFEVPF